MAKILLVDDDITVSEMYGMALQRAGYEVVMAGTGKSAHDQLMENKFDLTLLDMMMPGMTGIELISKIVRENKRGNMGKVIGFTSLDKDKISSRLDTFKIETCLDKSEVVPSELVKKVEEIIGN